MYLIDGPERVFNILDFWRTMLSRRRMIWLLAHPLPRQYARPATYRKAEKERQLADERGGGVGGAKSYGGEKAWSSINYSILSEADPPAKLERKGLNVIFFDRPWFLTT
jgi:hypothetical protein